MRIRFHAETMGSVEALWTPSPDWEGFRGIVHGGVVSTVLDEAMSKAVASMPCEALTAELRVRFRKPVRSSETLHIRGWVQQHAKRRIATEAILTGEDGTEYAHAWAVFLELPR
ncbi:MAG: PaaI family thioesterase [Bryobacterales bacterium]|nr:PaaI family thioesterase [Bryobacterales bacterium]